MSTKQKDKSFYCPFHHTLLTCLRGFVPLDSDECASLRDEHGMEYAAMYGSDKCHCAWIINVGPFRDEDGKTTGDLVYLYQSWPFTCRQTKEMFANPPGANQVHFSEDVRPEGIRRDMVTTPDAPTYCPFHQTQLQLLAPWHSRVSEALQRDFSVTHSTMYGSKECQCVWLAFYGNPAEHFGACHLFEHSLLQFDWLREIPGKPGQYEVVLPE